jgi:hypothetical protein
MSWLIRELEELRIVNLERKIRVEGVVMRKRREADYREGIHSEKARRRRIGIVILG